jgi:hypothetical protein
MLLGFLKLPTKDPASCLAVLRPWDTRHSAIEEQSKLIDELAQELAEQIEPVVADRLLLRLSEKGGMTVLWEQSGYLPEKWILFNGESPFWLDDRRERAIALLGRASSDLSIHGNALELIHMVSKGLVEGIGAYGPEKIKKLMEDRGISGSLWKAATARPVQYRSLSKVKAIREQFGNVCGTQDHLPVPSWMEAWEQQTTSNPNTL